MSSLRTILLMASLPLVAHLARAQEMQVKLDYDHDVDFTKYKTIGWSVAQEPAKNLANHVRITRSVEQAFAEKGLTKGPPEAIPDAFIMYHAKIEENVKVTGRNAGAYADPTNLRTMIDLNKVKQGTLVLEMYDARSRDLVWRSVASDIIPRPDDADAQIAEVVKKLLEGYPPGAPPKP
jgi:hypothetical protein